MLRALTPLVGALVVMSLGLSVSTAGAQQASSAETAVVKAAIEAANARFLEAFKGGDTAGIVANYTDDAVVMIPNEHAWRGREALERGFDAFLRQVSLKEGSTVTTDVMVSGDLAVETGTFQWTLQPKDGPQIKDAGKYLTVWKRQADGSWKIVRDINNSDLPRM